MISMGQLATPNHSTMMAENTMAVTTEDITPRLFNQGASKTQEAEESLLHLTPSASEKKSVMNSVLSDEDGVSTFEPAKGVTQSARKRAPARPSMAAISTTAQKDNVKVVIRVRPVNEREKAGGPAEKVKLCL